MLKIVYSKLIGRYYNDSLVSHFKDKTRKLIDQKYYWTSLKKDVKTYIKGCNVCLILKAVRNKLYGNLQLTLIPTYHQKDLSINFVIDFPISTNQKGKTYDSILIIINQLTKIVYYKPVRVIINAPGLAKVIFDMIF